MTPPEIQHFLLIYDIPGRITRVRSFGTDYAAAQAAYAEIESETWDRDDLDIVLVGADSLDTVRRTHSSYFHTEDNFESLLPEGVFS